MSKLLSITALLTILTAGYFYMDFQKPKDLCQIDHLKTSKLEIGKKEKERLGIHMSFSFDSKVKKYLPYIKKAQSNVYYLKWKNRPAFTSLSTQFKSKRSAKSAYKYLKKRWKKDKKNEYDVALKDKTVTWFRNSRYTPQCFHKVVETKKQELGIPHSDKIKIVAKKQKPKRKVVSLRKPKKIKKMKNKKRRLASTKK